MARILFVNTQGEIAGAERSLLLLMSRLAPRHEITVACPAPSALDEAVRENGCARRVLALPRARRLSSIPGAAYWLRSSMRVMAAASRVRADLIHANNLHSAAVSVPAAAFGRAGLVWHARDAAGAARLSRIIGRLSVRVIAVSNWVRERIVAQGVDARKVVVVHNGVEDVAPGGATPAARETASRTPFVFANVAQFVPWKKQALFLAAAVRVAREMPHARFWLVGDDVFRRNALYAGRLRRRVEKDDLSGRVVFTGWRRDMAAVYARIDCLVHAADAEPFGRVLIEAMAAGVPVIAVNAAGPAEIVIDGVTGILVPPDDPAAMAAAMLRIAADRRLAARLSASAREDVARRFAAQLAAERVERIYGELLPGGLIAAAGTP